MVIMAVMVIMAAMSRMAGIGTAQRTERLDRLRYRRPKALKHVADDMVAQDDDAASLDRGWQMAVADVPGELCEVDVVSRPHIVDRLVRRHHADVAPVVKNQQIPMLKGGRLDEVDEDLPATLEGQRTAAQVALVVLQHDHIEGLRVPRLSRPDERTRAGQLGEIGVE